MKKISTLLFIICFFSCNEKKISIESKLDLIKKSNYQLFNMISIEARNEKENVYKAPFLIKEANNIKYLLPNFKYYDCKVPSIECLKDVTSKKFDILEFSSDFNDDDIDPYIFVSNNTDKAFEEFEKMRIHKIVSNSTIGDCIIFLLNEKEYLAYVPNVENIVNRNWKSRFIKENQIDKNWYSGIR